MLKIKVRVVDRSDAVIASLTGENVKSLFDPFALQRWKHAPCFDSVGSSMAPRFGTDVTLLGVSQPLLVPGARARIELAPWVPPLALDGLDGYSHCWVLYIFHANTDGLGALDASLGPPKPGATFRAKV